jgi:septal ring factor EnvC (AmiA/AmiB activator)
LTHSAVESQGSELKQIGQTEASERAELEETKTKLAQLEASLAGTAKSNEDLKQEVGSKVRSFQIMYEQFLTRDAE